MVWLAVYFGIGLIAARRAAWKTYEEEESTDGLDTEAFWAGVWFGCFCLFFWPAVVPFWLVGLGRRRGDLLLLVTAAPRAERQRVRREGREALARERGDRIRLLERETGLD